jgi:hypothetical protein
METSTQEIGRTFGFDWTAAVAQFSILSFLITMVGGLIIAVWATRLSLRTFRGRSLLGWILVCWLLIPIGPIITILAARRHAAVNATT